MKNVRINVGFVGVVFRKGDFKRMLPAGKYWVGLFDEVKIYNMTLIYNFVSETKMMEQDNLFSELATVVELSDSELAVVYQGKQFDSLLTAGKYFFWNDFMDFRITKIDTSKVEITEDIKTAVLTNSALSKWTRTFKVESFEEGLLIIDGKFNKTLSKGTYRFWNNATSVLVLSADLRNRQLEVSGQEMLTRDKAGLRMNFFTQFRIVDVQKALLDNKDFEKQLYIMTQLALREFVGTLSLDALLSNKETIVTFVLNQLKEKAAMLGIEVSDAGIRDIILPGEVKDIMNQVLIAEKQAQANIITRREETASTRSLLNTAKLMESNEMLFKLKEMEYVEKIADKIGEISVSGGGKVVDQLKDIFTR